MDQERILNAFLQNNSLNRLTEEISEALQCPIIVTDTAFHIVASYCSLEYHDSIYKKAILHSELSIEACAEIGRRTEESENHHVWIETPERNFCVGMLTSAGVLSGYILYFLNPANKQSYDTDDFVLCESLLAKQLYIERHCSDTTESTAEEILEDLLEGKYEREELFDLQASGTYLAHFAPKHLAILDFCGYSDGETADARTHRLQTILTSCYHASHPIFYQNRIIMFLHADHDIPQFADIAAQFQLNIVISEALENLYAAKRHYAVMRQIAAFLSEKRRCAGVVFEREYLLLIPLLQLRAGAGQMLPEIGEMLRYDVQNGSELCRTLYTYLCCSRSLKKTSEIMFTHSNTVFYRIQKARDMFGVRVDADTLHFAYLVSLALALLELGQEEQFVLKDTEGEGEPDL